MVAPSEILAQTGLQTEFYQIVQAALYHADGMWGDATVDLFVNNLPEGDGHLVAAGIQPAIDAILSLQFSDTDVDWLQQQPIYSRLADTFFDSLRHFRFDGEIWAVREGTPVLPGEPVVRITAPLPHVGLFELILVQSISHASGIATEATRLVQAAQGRPVLDFGSRRHHGTDAAFAAARAAWIGGCGGTTHAHAAHRLGIPVVGLISDTMLAAYDDVEIAYDALRAHFPDGCHLNLPTEAPVDAIDRLTNIHDKVQTVRISHPDLAAISRQVRQRLDERGMSHTRILGSGNLDSSTIAELLSLDSPIDMFGVGGALAHGLAGSPPPMSYRMAEFVRGVSPVPVTGHWSARWPGRKQVVRFSDHDTLCLEVEADALVGAGGTALLERWVEDGERVQQVPTVEQMRQWCADSLDTLPSELDLRPSPTLVRLADSSSAR